MNNLPTCPKCSSEYTYEKENRIVFPECSYEWPKKSEIDNHEVITTFKDANGNILKDGD